MAQVDDLMDKARRNLSHYWGYPSFRAGQEEAIRSVIEKKDTLVLFPTGGGKSLCYQVPASVFSGVTVVISPLVALMQDQVMQLNRRGISATFINSNISRYEVEQRLVNARNGMYKLIYCAPERLKSELWQAEAPRIPIEMVAVDEAHCISEWGHDFRPVYREIRTSMEEVISEPIRWVALTATATPEVRQDILANLGFEQPEVISLGFERPNLKWWVIQTEAKDRKLFNILNKAEGIGLIYGGTRKNCERLAELISRRGIQARAYHAGIDGEEREEIQEAWIDGELPLVVATSAFGMGIDKEDCRFVVHYHVPYSLEAYYQEAGRAGRDGEQSYPILLYQQSDFTIGRQRIQRSYPTREELQKVYDALCDSMELAAGSEMEQARPVSIDQLAKRAQLGSSKIRRALKLMDQFDVIQYITGYEAQIGVHFTIERDYLEEKLEAMSNREKAEFVDRLARLYGWQSFYHLRHLEVDYLEEKLERSEHSIIKGLEILNKEQFLQYEFLGEHPLVMLNEPRSREVPVRKDRLENFRNMLFRKLDYMEAYVETLSCRSRFIRKYFGEREVPLHCDNCDNCSDKKSLQVKLQRSDIKALKQILNREPRSLNELKDETEWDVGRLREAINYLSDEGKIVNKIEDPYRYYWIESDDR